MKLVLRIFNIFILAIAAAATVCLFAVPTCSLNSNIALDVKKFSQFIPSVPGYTENIDAAYLIGSETIEVGISFELDINETTKVMNGNRDVINNDLISNNIDSIVETLREPVDLITSYTIRSVIKKTAETETTVQIQKIIDESSSGTLSESAEDIKEESGLDDEYFTAFANIMYEAANADNATVDTLTTVLYDQIDEALSKAAYAFDQFDKSSFSEDSKAAIRDNLFSVLNEFQLVNSDDSLVKISHISYLYLSSYLKDELTGKVPDEAELAQKTGEATPDYADRLLRLYVFTQTPDLAYQIIGYVALGLIIGLFVFAGLWGILFIFTAIKTFSKNKPWTFFGPWFWVFGSLQIVLGLALTVVGKFVLPNINLAVTGIPLRRIILAPRTYALIPSMLYIGCIFFAIVYTIFKKIAKRQYRDRQILENNNNGGYYDNNNGYDNGYNSGYNNGNYGNGGYYDNNNGGYPDNGGYPNNNCYPDNNGGYYDNNNNGGYDNGNNGYDNYNR